VASVYRRIKNYISLSTYGHKYKDSNCKIRKIRLLGGLKRQANTQQGLLTTRSSLVHAQIITGTRYGKQK
jgi:hypothetical protein